MRGNYIWRGGGNPEQAPQERGWVWWKSWVGAELGPRAPLGGHSQTQATPISLGFLPWSLPSSSIREQAANSIKDTYQLIEAMHRSLHSKHAAEVLKHCRC